MITTETKEAAEEGDINDGHVFEEQPRRFLSGWKVGCGGKKDFPTPPAKTTGGLQLPKLR